jgi:hypothetical protein
VTKASRPGSERARRSSRRRTAPPPLESRECRARAALPRTRVPDDEHRELGRCDAPQRDELPSGGTVANAGPARRARPNRTRAAGRGVGTAVRKKNVCSEFGSRRRRQRLRARASSPHERAVLRASILEHEPIAPTDDAGVRRRHRAREPQPQRFLVRRRRRAARESTGSSARRGVGRSHPTLKQMEGAASARRVRAPGILERPHLALGLRTTAGR